MTDSMQTPDPATPAEGGADVPPTEPGKAAKKAPGKKAAAAKKAVAALPEKGVYLPVLPEGFAFTNIEITGPGGESIVVAAAAGGKFTITAEGADMKRESEFDTLKEAAARAGKAAKGMDQIHKREKAAAEARQKAFDF